MQQRSSVRGELMQRELIGRRFARFAEANLIGYDDSPSALAQHPDCLFPGSAAEILPVQQHDRFAIRCIRSNVHVSHALALTLRVELEALDWIEIVETLEHWAETSARLRMDAGAEEADEKRQRARSHWMSPDQKHWNGESNVMAS